MDGDTMGFAFASGGYMVESNMGSLTMAGPEDITNWRASAATAQYSRKLAIEMYGGRRPYGYVYGGSGGDNMSFIVHKAPKDPIGIDAEIIGDLGYDFARISAGFVRYGNDIESLQIV